MKNIHINKRLAYTDQELITLVKQQMSSLGMNLADTYDKYQKFFVSKSELSDLINDKIDFNKDFYYFIEEFLSIPIEESTKIVYDKEIISARGELNTPEEMEFIDMLNLFFDTMIKCERFSDPDYIGSEDYLSGLDLVKSENTFDMVAFAKSILDINDMSNLPDTMSSRKGYFVIEFPNELGISGITMIKDTRMETSKHICIYVNSREPKGRRYFTYAHELYHVLFESSSQNVSYYNSEDVVEKNADYFANEIIFNREKMVEIIFRMNLSCHQELDFDDIIKIQENFNASFIAVLSNFAKMKKNETDPMLLKRIPKINSSLYKYKSSKYWDELIHNSQSFTNLNNYDNRFYAQAKFIENLINCYNKEFIGIDEYSSFMNFFDMEGGL